MTRTTSNSLMLLVALIWGTTFVAQQLGMQDVGPLTYTGARFLIGALFVSPLALREYLRLRAGGVQFDRRDLLQGSALGVLLFFGAVLQQVGVATTTVSNAGFLTALYVPMVPMLGWLLLRQRPHISVWPAALGSLVGTFLLSGGKMDALSTGDYWVIASTLFWAVHVLYIGRVAARKGAPVLVACLQFVVCAVIACVLAGVQEVVTLHGLRQGLPTILYAGLLSVGVAFTLQVVAQRHTRASDAAILLSSEILFAAIAAALYLGERLNAIQWLGGAMIFACIVAVQIAPLVWRDQAQSGMPDAG
ncbi:MAG: DMT family transporter [Rhodoferax sp.]